MCLFLQPNQRSFFFFPQRQLVKKDIFPGLKFSSRIIDELLLNIHRFGIRCSFYGERGVPGTFYLGEVSEGQLQFSEICTQTGTWLNRGGSIQLCDPHWPRCTNHKNQGVTPVWATKFPVSQDMHSLACPADRYTSLNEAD